MAADVVWLHWCVCALEGTNPSLSGWQGKPTHVPEFSSSLPNILMMDGIRGRTSERGVRGEVVQRPVKVDQLEKKAIWISKS